MLPMTLILSVSNLEYSKEHLWSMFLYIVIEVIGWNGLWLFFITCAVVANELYILMCPV